MTRSFFSSFSFSTPGRVRRLVTLAGLYGFSVTSACTVSEPPGATVAPRAEEASAELAVKDTMEADSIPAVAVAVYRGDEILWSRAFGSANLETGAEATTETRFRLGSVSKVLTAGLAVKLAEAGEVDLDADVRSYVGAFPDKGATLTLRQLLGHLGGIRHYTGKDYDFAQPGGMIDLRMYPDDKAVLALFADDPLVAEPGERYNYSTFGYTLVGLALESATGRSFGELLEREILAPAGIDDIAVDDSFALVANRTAFYDPIDQYEGLLDPEAFGEVVNAAPLSSAYKIPGGGLIGDAEAVAAFGALHFEPGFFSADAYEQLFTVQSTAAGEPTGVGLAWRVEEDDAGRRHYHHSGSQQGGRAHLSVYPDARLAVAVLTNLGGRPRDIQALAMTLAASFLEVPAPGGGSAADSP